MKKTQLLKQPFFTGNPQLVLLLRLGFVLLLICFSRILIFFFNKDLFWGASDHMLYYTFVGLRFDLVALLYANSLYIIALTLPFRLRRSELFIKITNIIFYISNSVLLILNLIDIVYYRFTLKRITSDIFSYVGGDVDLLNLLPVFIRDFWYILAVWLAFVVCLVFVTKRIQISRRFVMQPNLSYYFSQFFAMLALLSLTFLGLRGGTQLKPLGILHAALYAPPQDAALVLNSAFTLMRSSGKQGLKPVTYFRTQQEMNAFFNPTKDYSVTDTATGKLKSILKPNIVILILESFSTEHIGALNNQKKDLSFTPFLDSLISKSITYKGFANGKRSIEGVPAILSSLPTWMNQDFLTSPYGSNRFTSIAGVLKPFGYTSAFFHGGKNGTMGFDSYILAAGFDKYYGKNEYPNQNEYDGHWGIWDEPYLQYMATKLNSLPQPFCTSVFTLSSHHPYSIPEKYKNKFKTGKLPIQQSIMYTDFALRNFFNSVKKMPWYENTIFILTADHTSEASIPYFQSTVGQREIPIIFFNSYDTARFNKKYTAQQTDIMPTILDLMHYPKPFLAYGNSLLRENEAHFSLSFVNNNYQLIQNEYCFQCNENMDPIALYQFSTDSLLLHNQVNLDQVRTSQMQNLTKAIVQQYKNDLINNKLIIK